MNITIPEIILSKNIKDILLLTGRDLIKTPEFPQRNADNRANDSPIAINIYKKL